MNTQPEQVSAASPLKDFVDKGWDKILDADKIINDCEKVNTIPPAYDVEPSPEQLQAARARRTNPDKLNWGPWMNADELKQAGIKANRVPLPGDWDYNGVCQLQGGKWQVGAV